MPDAAPMADWTRHHCVDGENLPVVGEGRSLSYPSAKLNIALTMHQVQYRIWSRFFLASRFAYMF